MDTINVPEIFGYMVFNESVMREKLTEDAYKTLTTTITEGKPLESGTAAAVANAMKDWAIEKGATHYTHWFQPMTGITAEKHDSFITPTIGGKVIMEFSGKELVKGEPDASSFPSGGLRATFEARGYTAWDPTSYAFVKDGTLYIPTVFCSYSGQVLDKKTPLLRSMEAINIHTKRILKLFGKVVPRAVAEVGAEQEYFLIDKNLYNKRKDLMITGRTLFGAKPPKGQELGSHYFGTIHPRVVAYMKELDEELWKLGVFAKTKHNEAAPAQHELAPVFESVNVATDHNQLTMDMMKKLAEKHDMVCLLHEKPFKGVNGSGKHNNWSISANGAGNLLDPGKSPQDNAQFLLFLCAVLKAVDDYADMLRISAAGAGNDHRLGGNEAPPAIVSVFLGDELTMALRAIVNDEKFEGLKRERMEIGVDLLPSIPKDTSDRNRTSPFAFTGNKFEFRMLGSSSSIAGPNFVINTIVAESLSHYADELEAASDFNSALKELIKREIKAHERVIFNGNNYSQEWAEKAKELGLECYPGTVDCMPQFLSEKNVNLFEKHKVLTRAEIESRTEIVLETYSKSINIEGLTTLHIAKREIIPAVIAYSRELADTICAKQKIRNGNSYTEEALLAEISDLSAALYDHINELEFELERAGEVKEVLEKARYYERHVLSCMNNVRSASDKLEELVASKYWPFPAYDELLFKL